MNFVTNLFARLWEWIKRHPFLFIALVAVALLLPPAYTIYKNCLDALERVLKRFLNLPDAAVRAIIDAVKKPLDKLFDLKTSRPGLFWLLLLALLLPIPGLFFAVAAIALTDQRKADAASKLKADIPGPAKAPPEREAQPTDNPLPQEEDLDPRNVIWQVNLPLAQQLSALRIW